MDDGIDCMWMRGGTSKGAYFLREDLPANEDERNRLLLSIMGTPDPRQIDGIGGADPLTSKVAIVGRSERTGVDIDFLFLQVFVDQPIVTDAQNCGNILAGVAPFAVEKGLFKPTGDQSKLKVYLENSNQVARVTIRTPTGQITYDGDARIDGVPGTAAPVLQDFPDSAGSSCGTLLPTGNAVEQIDGIRVTLIDNGMPVVILKAEDMGISGYESRAELEANDQLRSRFEPTCKLADEFGIPHVTEDLAEALEQPAVDAAILCTPTQMHAEQALQCMKAGKHVQVEIPVADNWADAEAVYKKQQETGLVCMVGHTRRYNPSHQWINNKIESGEMSMQQMDVQTYFFRRQNMNAKGEPRSWTDHLLWHHAAHSVDLFQYQCDEKVVVANAIQGPLHPELGIAMDMSIQLKTESSKILTLSLSFNNDGPLGTFFRYICDNGTYIARYDDLVKGNEEPIDVSNVAVSMNGIELQDRDFISAIHKGREPNTSISRVLPCYRTLHELEQKLNEQG